MKTTIASVLIEHGGKVDIGAETAQSKMDQLKNAVNKEATETLIKQIPESMSHNFDRYLLTTEREQVENRVLVEQVNEEAYSFKNEKSEPVSMCENQLNMAHEGGEEIHLGKTLLKEHMKKLKVQQFISRVTSEEIARGSPLYKALRSLLGKRVATTIDHVV